MNKISLTIFSFLFSVTLMAQHPLVEKGNKHYSDQQFAEAAAAYEELLASGFESTEVYYNLGNAYYKSGQYTKAILNYERAKLLAPGDADIQFNLDLANQHVVDAIEPLPQVFFVRWWNNLVRSKPSDSWAKLSLFSFFAFLGLLALFVFAPSSGLKKLGFWAGILMFIASAFTFVFANKQKSRLTRHNFAIITQASVTAKSSPSEGGTNIFVIHEGLKVQLLDQVGNWYQVRLADGNQGWMPAESFEKI